MLDNSFSRSIVVKSVGIDDEGIFTGVGGLFAKETLNGLLGPCARGGVLLGLGLELDGSLGRTFFLFVNKSNPKSKLPSSSELVETDKFGGLENALDEPENEILPNVHRYPWVTWVANEEFILLDSDRPPHIAVLKVSADTHGTYNLTQDDYVADIQIQDGGSDINIKVVQKQ